jgi:hypothetical protein
VIVSVIAELDSSGKLSSFMGDEYGEISKKYQDLCISG